MGQENLFINRKDATDVKLHSFSVGMEVDWSDLQNYMLRVIIILLDATLYLLINSFVGCPIYRVFPN